VARKCVVGVDLGGTNVRAGAFYEDGTAAGEGFTARSRAQEGTGKILDALSEVIGKAVSASATKPAGVGLAIPGHVDDASGLVVWAPNFGRTVNGVFEYWSDVPVKHALEERVELPVSMGNDANLAALGEYQFGSGRNSANCLVMITVGTGIGGGVVMSPQSVQGDARGPLVLLGGNKGGVELGHVILNHGGLDCHAGTYGSLESYCQRDGIVRRAQHRLRRGRESLLREMTSGDFSKITPRMLSEAADQGDELSIEVWAEVGEMLGVGIGSFISIFAPDVVAVGGQIAKAGHWLLEPAIRTARNVAVPSLFRDCKIVQAEQIEDAGMLGAAALALEAQRWTEN
jgi:glucokinase